MNVRKSVTVLGVGFLLSVVLLAAPSAVSQEAAKGTARSSLRNDPDYARLYHDGKAFLALPPDKQEAMRKLHEDLQKLPAPERQRLNDALRRYADWLDKLPERDRLAVVNSADKKKRLQTIRKLREEQWLARQPKAIRQYLDKLPGAKPKPAVAVASAVGILAGAPQQMRPLAMVTTQAAQSVDLRAETISRLKRDQSRKTRDWVVASRHWTELTDLKRPAMPAHAADFGLEIETFVKEYLRPALDPKEQARLDKAEGQWPLYPMTLVELADKHPLALPQKRGPTAFKDLPEEVKKRLGGKMLTDKAVKKKDYDIFFGKQDLKAIELRLTPVIPPKEQTTAIRFACAVATWAQSKKTNVKMPHELWAAHPKDLSISMRVFLDEKGPFWQQLSADEHGQLLRAEGKWPEYPLKVQELANKYGFRPPWQALPEIGGRSEVWDKYRVKPYYIAEMGIKGASSAAPAGNR
jgi:hypothetical protein